MVCERSPHIWRQWDNVILGLCYIETLLHAADVKKTGAKARQSFSMEDRLQHHGSSIDRLIEFVSVNSHWEYSCFGWCRREWRWNVLGTADERWIDRYDDYDIRLRVVCVPAADLPVDAPYSPRQRYDQHWVPIYTKHSRKHATHDTRKQKGEKLGKVNEMIPYLQQRFLHELDTWPEAFNNLGSGRWFIIIIIDNRGLNARWCLTPSLLSLPTAAYLGQRGLTPAGLPHTTAQCQMIPMW